MASKSSNTNLIGRTVVLSFPNYNRERLAITGRPLQVEIRDLLGTSRSWLSERVDQEAEVVSAVNDDGSYKYGLLFSDGKVVPCYDHDFTVKPAPKPIAPRWEYTTLTFEEGSPSFADGMKDAGENGWELVTVVHTEFSTAYFKRPIL